VQVNGPADRVTRHLASHAARFAPHGRALL